MFDLDNAKDLISQLHTEMDKASAQDILELYGDITDYAVGNGTGAGTGEKTWILIIKGDDVEV